MNNNEIEEFIVTIYSVEKWGFAPYSNLNDQFQSKYEFAAYVQLISNIRQSLTSYVTDEVEILWTVKYRTMIKLELCLFILAIILAMGGTFLVPLLYSRKLFGFTLIAFGLTFCGIALIVCCILYLYNKCNGLIKRYKVMIFETIHGGFQQLNTMYRDKAIFQITEITSTRSCCQYAVQLDINCRIQLLCAHVTKYYPKPQNPAAISDSEKRAKPIPNPPQIRVEIVEKGKSKDAIALHPDTNTMDKRLSIRNKINNVQIFADVKDDVELENTKRSPIHLQRDNGDSCSDEKYIERDSDAITNKQVSSELYVFHSYQTLNHVMDLVNSHNNDEYDEAYNLYNIGRVTAKYFDDIFHDTNTVVVVSEKNKQPQLSYVSHKHFERKIKNINGNKDVFIYRSIDHIKLNPMAIAKNNEYSNAVEWFQRVVLNLTTLYNNTAKISFELDKIFGRGCHVARAPHNHYNVFSRYSDGLIARCEWKNGAFIIAWRR